MFHVVLKKRLLYRMRQIPVHFLHVQRQGGRRNEPKAEEGGAMLSVGESNGDTDKAKPGET
jgi:hypothetical protein